MKREELIFFVFFLTFFFILTYSVVTFGTFPQKAAMSTETLLLSKERQFNRLYVEIIYDPFKDKYEDKWEEDSFWQAIEILKIKSKEI